MTTYQKVTNQWIDQGAFFEFLIGGNTDKSLLPMIHPPRQVLSAQDLSPSPAWDQACAQWCR
jgi:hypothetical protein